MKTKLKLLNIDCDLIWFRDTRNGARDVVPRFCSLLWIERKYWESNLRNWEVTYDCVGQALKEW